ncbi:hypothetical protein BKK49_11280 [Rodentibacter rarus]|nr:hypothetical protein BKK49_11280 [Rodentibacter rarus]
MFFDITLPIKKPTVKWALWFRMELAHFLNELLIIVLGGSNTIFDFVDDGVITFFLGIKSAKPEHRALNWYIVIPYC